MSDAMTPEQTARAAEYSNAYRIGLGVGRGGTPVNWARWSDQSKAGYRAGCEWGQAHPLPTLQAACEDLAAELAIGQARTDGEAIPPVTLTFPGFPSIRGAGPAITEIPPVRPDWIYGPGGVRERVAERMAAEAEADAEGAE